MCAGVVRTAAFVVVAHVGACECDREAPTRPPTPAADRQDEPNPLQRA